MTSDALTRVVVTVALPAPAEQVFDAFVSEKVAQHFLFATATGRMLTARIDARVGGRFDFTERRPEMGEVRHVGEYLKIDRPHQLVFTFGVPQLDPRMTTVTNDGVPQAYAEPNREGWGRILAGLLAAHKGIHGAGWR